MANLPSPVTTDSDVWGWYQYSLTVSPTPRVEADVDNISLVEVEITVEGEFVAASAHDPTGVEFAAHNPNDPYPAEPATARVLELKGKRDTLIQAFSNGHMPDNVWLDDALPFYDPEKVTPGRLTFQASNMVDTLKYTASFKYSYNIDPTVTEYLTEPLIDNGHIWRGSNITESWKSEPYQNPDVYRVTKTRTVNCSIQCPNNMSWDQAMYFYAQVSSFVTNVADMAYDGVYHLTQVEYSANTATHTVNISLAGENAYFADEGATEGVEDVSFYPAGDYRLTHTLVNNGRVRDSKVLNIQYRRGEVPDSVLASGISLPTVDSGNIGDDAESFRCNRAESVEFYGTKDGKGYTIEWEAFHDTPGILIEDDVVVGISGNGITTTQTQSVQPVFHPDFYRIETSYETSINIQCPQDMTWSDALAIYTTVKSLTAGDDAPGGKGKIISSNIQKNVTQQTVSGTVRSQGIKYIGTKTFNETILGVTLDCSLWGTESVEFTTVMQGTKSRIGKRVTLTATFNLSDLEGQMSDGGSINDESAIILAATITGVQNSASIGTLESLRKTENTQSGTKEFSLTGVEYTDGLEAVDQEFHNFTIWEGSSIDSSYTPEADSILVRYRTRASATIETPRMMTYETAKALIDGINAKAEELQLLDPAAGGAGLFDNDYKLVELTASSDDSTGRAQYAIGYESLLPTDIYGNTGKQRTGEDAGWSVSPFLSDISASGTTIETNYSTTWNKNIDTGEQTRTHTISVVFRGFGNEDYNNAAIDAAKALGDAWAVYDATTTAQQTGGGVDYDDPIKIVCTSISNRYDVRNRIATVDANFEITPVSSISIWGADIINPNITYLGSYERIEKITDGTSNGSLWFAHGAEDASIEITGQILASAIATFTDGFQNGNMRTVEIDGIEGLIGSAPRISKRQGRDGKWRADIALSITIPAHSDITV